MNLKRVIVRGILGIPIGVFFMTTAGFIVSLILGELAMNPPPVWAGASPLTTFAVFYVSSCFIGFAFGAASLIFEIERWSIAKQSVLHFLVTSVVFLPASILCRWLTVDLFSIVIYFSVFILIYVAIWLVQYLIWKKKIQKLNEVLAKK
ncbi:MAG TPA: DUF3021 domain-containing protein [Bacillota bacterium]|nr:DUF3021 domain-containing protein [Bacillota bacterium]